MQEMIDIISTLGFPIFMVLYFIYDKNKTTQSMFDEVKENANANTEMIQKISDTVTTAVTNNTLVLTKFIEHFNVSTEDSGANV